VARRGKSGTRTARRPFKPFLLGFFALVLAAVVGAGVVVYREFTTALPPVSKLLDYRPPAVSRVLASDGTVIGEFFIEKRYVTPIYRIPEVVQDAFLAAEDANFYRHRGVDPMGIARAALNNYRAGSTRQGGSTITQQVVKSLLLSPERSYERKFKELILAFRLERELTKAEILYLYLNQIYLGNGAYGVQAAAREYFDKDVAELTLAEASLLAGLPQAPSRYSPVRHFERAKARQRYVLDRMVAEHYITRDEAAAADEVPIVLRRAPENVVGLAPHFVEHVRRRLVARYGSDATYQLGLNIHTTIDLRMQAIAEEQLAAGVRALDDRQGFRGPLRRVTDRELKALRARPAKPSELPAPGSVLEVVAVGGADGRLHRPGGGLEVDWADGRAVIPAAGLAWATSRRYVPQPGDVLEVRVVEAGGKRSLELTHANDTQGALIAMVPATGDVKAMVGGLDYRQSEFNRATQAMRQPGSAFKPLIYTAAMDRGFTPASVINDAPVSYRDGTGKMWSPKNFTKKFLGPTSLRTALTESRNVVTVKLVDQMGLRFLIDYLPRFGLKRPFPKNLSIALGTAEVTLLELVEAYSVFPNLGRRIEPRFITRITDTDGRVIEEYPVVGERTISADTAYITVNLLANAMRFGTGKQAMIDRPAAGKTGTTNDQHDAWFMGFTPELLTGIWVGYDHEKSLGKKETGGRAAAPIWREFTKRALEGVPISDFPVPHEIMLVNIDRRSGLRARPGQGNTMLEAFKRGTEPSGFAPGPQPREPESEVAQNPSSPGPPGTTLPAGDPSRRYAPAYDDPSRRYAPTYGDPSRRYAPADDPSRRYAPSAPARNDDVPAWADPRRDPAPQPRRYDASRVGWRPSAPAM
jgi:penicillin-binding protein 1A